VSSPPQLLHDVLVEAARSFPDREAWVDDEARVSFQEAAVRVAAFAGGLRDLGVRAGDRVVIWLPPSVDCATAMFAASYARAVLAPAHPPLHADQVAALVRDCEARAVVTTAERLEELAVRGLPADTLLVATDRAAGIEGTVHTMDVLCMHAPIAIDEETAPDSLAAIVYTSGSTGPPKGVMHTHRSLLSASAATCDLFGLTASDRVLRFQPLSTISGVGLLLSCPRRGSALVMTRFGLPRAVVAKIVEERISVVTTTPFTWKLLARPDAGFLEAELPNLRVLVCGGGPPPIDVLVEIQRKLPDATIWSTYSQTESPRSGVAPLSDVVARPGTLGRAVGAAEIRIVDDSGRRCPPGEVGEIVEHNASLAVGYWKRPEETRRAWRTTDPDDARTWFHTGDLGKMDVEGNIHCLGRKDAAIKVFGYRISRTEIEDVLLRADGVEGAAVIGVPDEILEQRIVAFVTATGGSFSIGALRRFCEQHLAKHMVPREIHRLDAMPLLSNGKIDYVALSKVRRGDD
jgi:acyl-CoA synthetase (AMP-forming)/AMP-acid ligase II